MLVTCKQMQEAEEALFSDGTSPEPYMDEAGRKCADAVRRFFPNPGRAEVFVGKGNNGGDALVVARWLKCWGWLVELHFSHGRDEISELATRKLAEFEQIESNADLPRKDIVLIDGLLGIGASGDLRGGIREQADQINELRQKTFATCFAIDIPTGLNADTGEPGEGAVMADYTLSITVPKLGFAADAAVNHVGCIVEIPLDIPVDEADETKRFLFPSNLLPRLKRRNFDTHKGEAGRVTVIAGSRGMAGAAVMSAESASLTGAGLVTVCVPEAIYSIVASQCSPEIMVKPVSNYAEAAEVRTDVFAIGPGLGEMVSEEILEIISTHQATAVVDADALNALAKEPGRLQNLPANRILTPHPGELSRLSYQKNDRVSLTRELADKWGVTLIHKGARTAIATPGRPIELNTTGHPGMASGGMGDVLTGICAGLAAQGMDEHDSACVGSWLLGRAAELARDENRIAPESVTAALVSAKIGRAFRELQSAS